jgi:branched-chain amino acid transport system ATP-binding protein
MQVLHINNLTVHYGKALAVEKVFLDVEKGGIVTLIGSNGAGKTTILNVISGLKKQTRGEVWFSGKRIDGMAPFDIVRLGLVHVPEGRRIFPFLSVAENLKLGASVHNDRGLFKRDLSNVYGRFPVLQGKQHQKSGSLSGGEQQMLAIGRAMMAKPQLLMLDEPSLGLAPIIVDELKTAILQIHGGGVSILLVEQNVSLALGLAKSGYVLEVGSIILQGDMSELRDNEIIQRAYLGG